MGNKDEIVKLILRFCYGATDVFLHSYPDEETLTINRYITFEINDVVKHMYVDYRDYDFSDKFDVSEEILAKNDGVCIWTPSEIVLFPTNKVIKEIEEYRDIFGYNDGSISLAIVSGYLTRIKINASECKEQF